MIAAILKGVQADYIFINEAQGVRAVGLGEDILFQHTDIVQFGGDFSTYDLSHVFDVESYVATIMAEPEVNPHPPGTPMYDEHNNLLALVPRPDATFVAVRDLNWSDPNAWWAGTGNPPAVPGPGAKVLIPHDRIVHYDLVSTDALDWVRVDGSLIFDDVNTEINLDTLVVDHSGFFTAGTEASPLTASMKVNFLDGGDIDVVRDPSLLSRGAIFHGTTEIHGAVKTPFLKVAADPIAGATTLDLESAPSGWNVGDRLILTGTRQVGKANDGTAITWRDPEDEELTITAINGAQITFTPALVYDHTTPRADLKAYVANMTRNIEFTGDATLPQHRGHVMFMHSDAVNVRYAMFNKLGRTNKDVEAGDPDHFGGVGSLQPDTNIKGRYPIHLHMNGVDGNQVVIKGCVVDDTPGWGYTHHSANASIEDCIAHKAFGAGFAAEDGDETGIWIRNLAMHSAGHYNYRGDWAEKVSGDIQRHDNGRAGAGFFFAGRLVHCQENIAANTNHGYVWMHRSAPKRPLTATLDEPKIAYLWPDMSPDKVFIQGFRANEAFCNYSGLIVLKDGPDQGHDARTVMDGFKAWEVQEGANMSYTGHYTFKDFDIVASISTTHDGLLHGVDFTDNTYDMCHVNLTVEGFPIGARFTENNFTQSIPVGDKQINFVDATFINCTEDTKDADPAEHKFFVAADLIPDNLTFTYTGDPGIAEAEDIFLQGDKTDSLGAVSRILALDGVQVSRHQMNDWLRLPGNGYYTTTDGKRWLLIEDIVSDRVTGEFLHETYPIELTFHPGNLNGVADLGLLP